MKLVFVFAILSQAILAQDVAEPLDISILLTERDKAEPVVLADLFRRVGSVTDFDFVAVVYDEHVQRGEVLGMKGLRTGSINPAGGATGDSQVVYIPAIPVEITPGDARKTFKVDPHRYDKILEAAWLLTKGQKIGVQSINLEKNVSSLRTCYFLVNSRLFVSSSTQAMIGGYIQNPAPGTKTDEFLKSIETLLGTFGKEASGSVLE